VLQVHNFTYGLVTPGLSYVVAFLGCLLGLRCVTRARACQGGARARWLLLAGFALGASFENSVVFDDTRLLNTEGLRYSDECVRHKVLDVIGDLALAGLPLLGAFRSVRGGHKLNHAVLTALLADVPGLRLAAPGEPADAALVIPGGPEPGPDVALTPRELHVLALIAEGASNKAIARRLAISVHTVKFHIASLLDKLDAQGRAEAVAQGARLGAIRL